MRVKKVDPAIRYRLEVSAEQAKIISAALDCYGRLLIGQLRIPLEEIWRARNGGWSTLFTEAHFARRDDLLAMLSGLENGAWRSIGQAAGMEKDRPDANTAFDVHRVIRKRLYLDAGGDPKEGGVVTEPIYPRGNDRLPTIESLHPMAREVEEAEV